VIATIFCSSVIDDANAGIDWSKRIAYIKDFIV